MSIFLCLLVSVIAFILLKAGISIFTLFELGTSQVVNTINPLLFRKFSFSSHYCGCRSLSSRLSGNDAPANDLAYHAITALLGIELGASNMFEKLCHRVKLCWDRLSLGSQAVLEPLSFFLQPLECWDYWHVPPYLPFQWLLFSVLFNARGWI